MTERRTIAAVSVALVRGETVLLVKRALEPSRGLYAFPGGRVEAGETSEEAARRELLEETGLIAAALSPLREYLIDTQVDGEEITYRLEVFTGEAAGGEPAGASDAEEACFSRWRKWRDFRSPIHPGRFPRTARRRQLAGE